MRLVVTFPFGTHLRYLPTVIQSMLCFQESPIRNSDSPCTGLTRNHINGVVCGGNSRLSEIRTKNPDSFGTGSTNANADAKTVLIHFCFGDRLDLSRSNVDEWA